MRKLFLKIFGEHPATDATKLTMFSWHHILYLILIIGTIVLLTILFNKKEQSKKEKLLKIISILVLVVYLGDFFILHCPCSQSESPTPLIVIGIELEE